MYGSIEVRFSHWNGWKLNLPLFLRLFCTTIQNRVLLYIFFQFKFCKERLANKKYGQFRQFFTQQCTFKTCRILDVVEVQHYDKCLACCMLARWVETICSCIFYYMHIFSFVLFKLCNSIHSYKLHYSLNKLA